MPNGEREIKRGNLNREILVFVFFLVLSSLFWYLNELSKDLEASLNYPVRYINPPKDRILTGDLPDRIGMVLQGPGYSILKMKLSGSRAPVVVDLSKITPGHVSGKPTKHYIVCSDLIESFALQLHSDFNIAAIKPDTIFFEYDKLVARKKPVIPDVKVEVSRSYKAIVVAEPDSIVVTGPKHILDSIPGIMTKKRIFPRVSETFKATVLLVKPEYLQLDRSRVDLEITVVKKYSEKSGWATPPSEATRYNESSKMDSK